MRADAIAFDAAELPDPSVSRRRWIRRVVIAAAVAAIGYTIIGLVERVDWASAWDAITHVHWWQLALMFAVLIVRQVFNAMPLALFMPGLGLFRATVSDQAATLVSMVAPPPSDMVVRLKALSTWGIDAALGLAGSTMNVLAFYINRLLVPTFGLAVLVIADGRWDGYWVALVSLAAGGVLLVLTRLSVNDAGAAERIGLGVGRLAQRVRKTVEPETWAAKLLEFRRHIVDRFAYAFPRSLLFLFVMTLIDSTILVIALRSVGVPPSVLPVWLIVGGFLLWFPMTITPMQGLGLLDAVLVALYTSYAGEAFEPEILAALLLYRVVTLGGPCLLGLLALGLWRFTLKSADETADGVPESDA